MARPFKSGVDYFPLDVILDDKFELIEAVHGLVGFGIVIKLYQKVYANSYYFNVTEKYILVLSNRLNVDINSINAVINDCVKWEIFSQKLYEQYSVLTSKGIQERYFEIVKRRKKVCIDQRFLLVDHNLDKVVIKLINVDINSINVSAGTQSKVNEIKGKLKKEIKKEEEEGQPPNSENSKTQKTLTKCRDVLGMSDVEIKSLYGSCHEPEQLAEAVQVAIEVSQEKAERGDGVLSNPRTFIISVYKNGSKSKKTREAMLKPKLDPIDDINSDEYVHPSMRPETEEEKAESRRLGIRRIEDEDVDTDTPDNDNWLFS
jgi:hypothetical protein